MGVFEDNLRKAQLWRQQADAQTRLGNAETNLATAQENANQGFDLGKTLADIGKSVTSGAKGLWDMVAGGVNEIGAGIQNTAWGNDTRKTMKDDSAKRNEIAKKYGYASYADASNDDNASKEFWDEIRETSQNTMDKLNKTKEAVTNSDTYKNLQEMSQNKMAADAIRAENFLADVLLAATGGAAGSNPVVNGIQGALNGLADELENSEGLVFDPLGGNFSAGNLDGEKVAKSMASNAVGSMAGSAVGSGLGKLKGGNALSKIAGSNVGRGSLASGASSAVTAGAQTALDGGSLDQVLSNAANAGGQGMLFGGLMAGGMGLANKGYNKFSDMINKETTPNTLKANKTAKTTVDVIEDIAGEKATGWGEKDMTGSVKKKNALQKIGSTLQDTGQKTEDSAIIGKLKGNLADEVAAKNSVQRLREIGFEPSDYEQAANLSEVANKWYSDQVKKSKVTLDMPDTYKLADDAAYFRQMDADQAAKLKSDITKRLDAVRKTGGGLATFDAEGLERVARDLGQDAEKMTTTNYGGSKKRISNLDAKTEAYANALKDIRAQLRSKVDDMTDYDATTFRKVLKDAGATDKQIEYLADAKSMAQVKRNTSLLEDARNMYRQSKSSPLKRGANADNSTSLTRQVANASGAGGLLNTALEPVGKVIGKAEKGIGKVISNAGDALAGKKIDGGAIGAKLGNMADKFANSAINTDNLANSTAGDIIGALTAGTQRGAIRQNALNEAENASQNIENQRALDNAMSEYQAAKNNYDTTMAQAIQPSQADSQLNAQLVVIQDAMNRAIAAGDLSSYSELVKLYKNAYEVYQLQNELNGLGNAKLTTKQQSALDEANNSLSMVDQLEQAFNNAGGGKGFIGGNLAEFGNWATGGNANAALSTYDSLKQSLGTSIVKNVVNLGGTEADAQRYLAMLPSSTDTAEQASQKLEQLRLMLNNMKKNIGSTY